MTILSLAAPVSARNVKLSQAATPAAPTKAEVLAACTNNQAQTLPNPFVDLAPDHWAFQAVMNLYYCGAGDRETNPAVEDQG